MDLEKVTIEGKRFRFVKTSRRGGVAVYTSGDWYARVGELAVIEKMLALHKKFDGFGFPVPVVMGRGEISAGSYFLEESLGGETFSALFSLDEVRLGEISPELFERFLKITEKFAKAALRSATAVPTTDSFSHLIRPDELAAELPEYADKILSLYNEAVKALSVFPYTLTHGDFNPHNLFPGGVIDFEEEFYAPFGYDLVTNIFHINYFPKSKEYEFFRGYAFTLEQEASYYRRLDALCLEAGLVKLSDYKKYFEYCRAIWAAKDNFAAPKLQQWRYELFKKQYLV